VFSMLKDCKITRVLNSVTAGTSAQNTSVLDMSGWDGVLFVALLGDVTSGSVLTLTAYENTANSTSSPTPTAVTGGATSAVTAGASDADNLALIVDVNRPSKQYVYAALTRTTQNAVIDGVVAIQYKGRTAPVTQGATVLASALSTPN
jgi:hypothetical protein